MKAKRAAAVIISLLFVFVMLFSALIVIAEADHDCAGEDCPVCRIIAIGEETLKISFLLLGAVIIATASFIAAVRARRFSARNNLLFNPVLSKVKLTN